ASPLGAARSSFMPQRLSKSEAKALAGVVQTKDGVRLVVTDEVLALLNKAISTSRSRMNMREIFRRMKVYEPMIRRKMTNGGLPDDLLAVPIVESGYRNIAGRNSAGLWQFIPGTARRFGLRVEMTGPAPIQERIDERYDEEKSTEAAVAYFARLYREFEDWHAVLLAYNVGERRVLDEMHRAGHRDVLKLIREGRFEAGPSSYLPKVIASAILMKNPQLTQD
ncbi:MAG: lytic transglycosylase domain-containing protein, partial [Bdellovibrionaceae bacterium]|nr:lytic transglycosylase domain-containing protein [Pseudobdellovibrionaceae bacterium]